MQMLKYHFNSNKYSQSILEVKNLNYLQIYSKFIIIISSQMLKQHLNTYKSIVNLF